MAIMEQNKMLEATPESGSKPPSTTPAYFVILHQPQGDTKEERILVANRDASAVASVVQPGPHESKSNNFLSADCISGGITVTLDNNNMWNEFCRCSTEMVLTKQGRRMFPYCRYWISGMDPFQKYILAMDIAPLDTHKYKWNGKWWEPGGKAEPHVLGRAFIHPESPSTGQYWMHQPISFYKLKLTNNVLDQEGHIILHSMHRYLPRLHVIPAEKTTEVIQLNGPDVHTFTFPQTEFFAVTAYQNLQITQLKIDCNPFAKGFREGTVVGRPPKEGRSKNLAQAKDSSGSKKFEHDDPEITAKLKDSFSMSEQSDVETENESFSTNQELQTLSNSQTTVLENLLQKLSKLHSLGETHTVTTPSAPVDPPTIKIKEEPEDNYDYDKGEYNPAVQVKQEETDDEVTDEYSNSDDDYPILERHFAQFSTKLNSDRKHSVRSPSGVAKAKLLKLDDGKMPVVYLESCQTNKTPENVSNSQEVPSTKKPMRKIKLEECTDVYPSIVSCKREEVGRIDEKRPIKRKIYADYAVPVIVRTSRGRRKKLPSVPAKSKATANTGGEIGVAPVAKRRGRPPKNKGAKVGRPPKKKPPIQTPQLFPDFKPDLEDVDGVLFVAFSSKEALDVHTGGKPKTDIPLPPPDPPVHVELTEEQQKIVNLEKQLLVQLKTMRHRQVIHPSLQQVGLRLNILDHAMSIDLRYLGVELPLSFIPSDSRWDNCGLSSEGLPFVSRTGKTTDYTKIKGWRDKFSTNPSVKSEAGSSETTLKNRSAFCSDELDEYLENEAKLMEDMRGSSQNETVLSTVNFQFPTKSSSYVRTLDSVLKKQALQASSNSLSVSKPPAPPLLPPPLLPPPPLPPPPTLPSPLPVKKRKYTRRTSTPKLKLKIKPILPPAAVEDKPVKSPPKLKSPKKSKLAPSLCVRSPATSPPGERPPLSELDVKTQPSVLSPGEDPLWLRLHRNPFQSPQFTHRSVGISKVQMKLLELEESALCQGKPRTYVTEERAEIALSALLTIQGFLKGKPFHKMTSKRIPLCKNEFCRLGCVCASLNHAKHKRAHCQQEACMFGCDCANSTSCLEQGGRNVTCRPGQKIKNEDAKSPINDKSGATAQQEEHTDGTDKASESQEVKKAGLAVNKLPGGEANVEGIKALTANSQESADSCSKHWSPKVFPIWDRSDVDNDPEPICIREKGEVIESKTPYHRVQLEKGKSSANKSSHPYTARQTHHLEATNSEDPHHFTTKTCARIRVYKRKATEEKAKKDHVTCGDSETSGKENSHKPNKYREREKENAGDSEVPEKRHKKTEGGSPTKLLNIISDFSWEQDPKQILNIVSQHVDNKEPQSFRVGSFNIELTSENKEGDSSKSSATSRVKISMAPEQKTNQVSAKPLPVKGRAESVKVPEQIASETRAENEPKSHGGKGLPFYTKVIPAGKLVAQLKNSTPNQSELIQVNGKKFPQAKLLLGQMGALHPANRIAAYITHRLRPSLLYLSKANEAKAAASNEEPESSTANGSGKVTLHGDKPAVTSPESNTVLPSTPSGGFIPLDTGDGGSLKQKSPEVRSPEATAVGLPKMQMQSPPLVLAPTPVSSSNAVTVVSSSSVNMVSTTPTLSSDVVSPTKSQAASLPTPLIGAPKLITKDSSLPVSTTLTKDTNNPVTLTSSPPKYVSIPPPALIRAPCPPVTPSSVSPPGHPGTNKTLAASVASSLVASANVPTIGQVGSPTGRPTLTLRTVTSPSTATRANLTSGLEKRLGPRLLLIPVGNGSAPVRPLQCAQTSPGQKTVLQSVKGPNGINLFRHPNGQLIQLLPLHQIQAANIQQSQRVVIRSPGPAVNIQLPPKTKTDVVSPTSATAGSSSVPSAPVLQTFPLSKISPVKSGVTVIPKSPSQIATLRITASPRASSDVSPSSSKVLAYTCSSSGVLKSTGVPVQSGGLPVLKCSPSTVLSSSSQDSAAKPKVILMTGKSPVVIDANKLANVSFFKSAKIVLSNEKHVDIEYSKECKESSSLENVNVANMVTKQNETKESARSAEQEVSTPSMEKLEEAEKRSRAPSVIIPNGNESKKSQKSSMDKEAGSPSKTVTVNAVAGSEQDVGNPVAKHSQDPENPVTKHAQDPENPVAENAEEPENPVAENGKDLENPEGKREQDPENSATERTQDPDNSGTQRAQDPENRVTECAQDRDNSVTERTQDPGNTATEHSQDPENTATERTQDPDNLATERARDPDNSVMEHAQDPEDPATENPATEHTQDHDNSVTDIAPDSENPATVRVQDADNSEAKNTCVSLEQDCLRTVELVYNTVQKQPEADSEVNQQTLSKSEEKEEGGKGDITDFTANEQDQNLPLDPGYNSSARESEHYSQSEDESEADEPVDIETVEEISGEITHFQTNDDRDTSRLKSLKGRKKGSKVNGDDIFEDGESTLYRKNHTANERKRRNEMRDLFEELKNALGLHNLPKVSKSYILKKAIEEIEGLTDTADSLIRQKTMMSQKQSQLIKKVSNLSGKPKEVVLKKLEYLYAKQNALEAERKKEDLEEVQGLKSSVKKALPQYPSLNLENEADESSSSKTKKPIILSRKPVLLSTGAQQPAATTTPNLLMKESRAEQVAGISPTLVQADVRPPQMQTGMASVVIQLPGAIQLKGLIGNNNVPITLSAVPRSMSATAPLASSTKSENDDLSMMPKIVNVTSLAKKASSDLAQGVETHPLVTKSGIDPEAHTPLADEELERELPSTQEKHSMTLTQSPDSSLPENLPVANISHVNAETSLTSENAAMNDTSLANVRDSELEFELKKLSSAIDEAELEPNVLSEVMGDHEDSDETLTSLLNEIALLNQQLNNDHVDLGCDFPGSDTPSQGSVGKSADSDSSPFFFGRFRELSDPKEKNISFSPLFLHLEEGEIQESVKPGEEPSIVFEDVAHKEALTKVGNDLPQPSASIPFLHTVDKTGVASSSDVQWRPMPKLAPLGLKLTNVHSEQRVLGNKSMPSLASAAVRLGSPKPTD